MWTWIGGQYVLGLFFINVLKERPSFFGIGVVTSGVLGFTVGSLGWTLTLKLIDMDTWAAGSCLKTNERKKSLQMKERQHSYSAVWKRKFSQRCDTNTLKTKVWYQSLHKNQSGGVSLSCTKVLLSHRDDSLILTDSDIKSVSNCIYNPITMSYASLATHTV